MKLKYSEIKKRLCSVTINDFNLFIRFDTDINTKSWDFSWDTLDAEFELKDYIKFFNIYQLISLIEDYYPETIDYLYYFLLKDIVHHANSYGRNHNRDIYKNAFQAIVNNALNVRNDTRAMDRITCDIKSQIKAWRGGYTYSTYGIRDTSKHRDILKEDSNLDYDTGDFAYTFEIKESILFAIEKKSLRSIINNLYSFTSSSDDHKIRNKYWVKSQNFYRDVVATDISCFLTQYIEIGEKIDKSDLIENEISIDYVDERRDHIEKTRREDARVEKEARDRQDELLSKVKFHSHLWLILHGTYNQRLFTSARFLCGQY